MKRTDFHKVLIALTAKHDFDRGIAGLCEDTGIPYQTMRKRLNNPRALRWYEYLAIVDSLHLDEREDAELRAAIK